MKAGGIFRRLLRTVKAARLLARAEDLASRERAREAMTMLGHAHAAAKAEMPSEAMPISANLLLCQVAIATRQGALALDAATTAMGQLNAGRGSYSSADRRYLLAFATALTNYCLRWEYGDDVREHPNPVYDIPLQDVSGRLRHRFVLPPDGAYLDPALPRPTQEMVH